MYNWRQVTVFDLETSETWKGYISVYGLCGEARKLMGFHLWRKKLTPAWLLQFDFLFSYFKKYYAW